VGLLGEQLAYVIYTSGSTGLPKGVLVPHRALANFLRDMEREPGLSSADMLLAVTSVSFDIAGLELLLPLACGARVIVADRTQAGDGHALRELLSATRPSRMQATPSTWHLLLEAGWRREDAPGLVALCGGEALSAALAARLLERCEAVWNLYGPTETTIWSTRDRVTEPNAVTIGAPIANTRACVLDPDGQPAPRGVEGELFLGGDGVARGYHARPGLTAERFVPDPFGPPGCRLYRTGDRVRRREDGKIEFLGRLDDQLKVRGHRVEPGEIEAVLLAHESVGAAAVVPVGERSGLSSLAAYVVRRGEESATTPGALREHLRDRLPIALIPSRIEWIDALPRTPSGKMDRRSLRASAMETRLRPAAVPPRSPLEERLAAIWREVLEVERVGVHDTFFELGGHSILATRLVARVREAFGVPLPLRRLLEHPTVAELAAALSPEWMARPDSATAAEDVLAQLPTITPDPARRHEPFPLTDVQQAYWVGRTGAFELGRVSTHAYAEIELESLDLERLERAWRRLIDRHDMLRAVILPDGRQRVLEEVPPYSIRIHDWSALPEEEAEARLTELREELSHQVLPSDRWPLFDLRGAKLQGGRIRLCTSFDLLIGDAWSFQVLSRELTRLYEDPQAPLPPLQLTFRDYVLAADGLREGELHRESLAYWRGRLPALPPPPELPLSANPAALDAPRFTRREARLDPEAWRRFRASAARRGLTPSGAVAAAFAEILAAWSAASRFTLNLTLFHRAPLHEQVNELVGDFTSVNLLEVDLAEPGSFEGRARRIQGRLWDDLDHSWVSGVQVLRELARARGGTAVLMPVVFTSLLDLDARGADPESAEVSSAFGSGRVVFSVTQTPQVWLDHQASVENGAMLYSWDAVEELFPPGLLDAMFEAYRDLLGRLAGDDGAWREPVLDLRPLAQRDRHTATNATDAPPPTSDLFGLFVEQECSRGDAAALIGFDRTLSYRALGVRARDLAQRLREAGTRQESLVAVVMEKGWEQVAAVLGVVASGAAYLPVDPSLPADRVRRLLVHGSCRVALVQPWIDARIDWPEIITPIVVQDEPSPPRADLLTGAAAPNDLAYVMYTSGSTGEPKGVMIEHRGAVNTILDINRRFGVGPEDRVLALSSLSFDLSVWDIFGALGAGAAVVMPEPGAPDPARWARALREHQVTIWNSVPALMDLLVEYLEARGERLAESLRLVLLSGDWIPRSLPGRIRALGRSIQVVSLGGATEASIWSILHPIVEDDPEWPSIPYGRPMVNQRFHILDEWLRPRPDWAPGELFIAGTGLARGYWRDEIRTRERFLDHPQTGERLYRTGDLGRRRPSGEIEFLGRRDFQVKVQGYRIELGEIEHALVSHAGIRSAVVVARGGAGEAKHLVAYVAPSRRPGPAARELRDHLAAALPPYMVPALYVEMETLPLGANGKVDRSALPDPPPRTAALGTAERSGRAMRGVPVRAGASARQAGADRITRIVAEVLGHDEVDPDVNLLEMGASSVDIVRVANRLESELGFRPGIDAFYREPTVSALVRLLEQQSLPPAEDRAAPAPPEAKTPRFAPIVDPAEREAFKRRRPGIRPLHGERTTLSGGGTLVRGASHRTCRRFATDPVAAKDFARLLGCLGAKPEGDRTRYRYGSAGGLYPVQVYAHVEAGRVEGVATGTYYYHPIEHQLISVVAGAMMPLSIHEPFINRPVAETAAFSIFLIGELAAIEPIYGEHALRFATLEAGLMTQLLEDEGMAAGLGLCQIGTLDFDRVRPFFQLGESHVILNCLLGGRPRDDRGPALDPSEPAREEFEI
jgi:amino acid adenylation domain-containing protein